MSARLLAAYLYKYTPGSYVLIAMITPGIGSGEARAGIHPIWGLAVSATAILEGAFGSWTHVFAGTVLSAVVTGFADGLKT